MGVIVDVQGSGAGAGALAWWLLALAFNMGADGASAAAIAWQMNAALVTRRGGRVQAGVGVVLIEHQTETTTACYGSVLAMSTAGDQTRTPAVYSVAAGRDRHLEPAIAVHHLAHEPLTLCSDGIADSPESLVRLLYQTPPAAHDAHSILERAIERDHGRPRNDMSIIVARTSGSRSGEGARGSLSIPSEAIVRRADSGHG